MPPRRGFTLSDTRPYLPYFLLLVIFVAGVWFILAAGSRLHPVTVAAASSQAPSTNVLRENFRTPLSILLTQIIVRSCENKVRVVEADEREDDYRAVLNLSLIHI